MGSEVARGNCRRDGNRLHAMTVDVEDWLNATILQLTGKVLPPGGAIVEQCEQLLSLFAKAGCTATWFFLAELADSFPGLVRKVAEKGHEIGLHGLHHHQISAWSPDDFRRTIGIAKDKVEQAAGCPVRGYRAVDFGINCSTWWALDILAELGFAYDASVFPMHRPRYGMPESAANPYWVTTESQARILEIPVTISQFLGIRIPFAGGGYFRSLPYGVVSALMRREARRGSVVFYMHPCEIDPSTSLAEIPPGLARAEGQAVRQAFVSQRRGREKGLRKLTRLMAQFSFGSIRDVFGEVLASGQVGSETEERVQ